MNTQTYIFRPLFAVNVQILLFEEAEMFGNSGWAE